jgi:kynurenine 3-monooxygenase
MHTLAGELNYQPYGREGQAIYSVSRGKLNIQLLELADEYPNITLYFNHRCVDVNIEEKTAIFTDEHGNTITSKADRILGTDGAFAATRSRMQISDRFNYSQTYEQHGYKELAIPAGPGGSFLMNKNSLHIWPRGGYMMIALPNPAGDFTCTLFMPFEGEESSFAALDSEEKVLNFFKARFPDAVPMMPTLTEDFFANPTSSLVTVRCFPWVKDDKIALMGDAAHAVVPFYGQGMNCSFEDCVVMDDCIEKFGADWNKVFSTYQQLRKPNADAIADLALQNFVEMRDLVGKPEFLKKKHIEHDLVELYPEDFKSQYELVTFTQVPYRKALEQGAVNDKVLETILQKGIDVHDKEQVLQIIREANKKLN